MIDNYISGWCTTASTGAILPSFHVACWLPHCLWYCDNVLMRIYKQYFDRKDIFHLAKKQQTGWRWSWLCPFLSVQKKFWDSSDKRVLWKNFFNEKLNTVWGMVTTSMFLITDDLKGGTNNNELWYYILHFTRLFSGFGFFFSSRTFAFLPTFPVELVDSHSICHRESFSPAFPLREKCFLLLFSGGRSGSATPWKWIVRYIKSICKDFWAKLPHITFQQKVCPQAPVQVGRCFAEGDHCVRRWMYLRKYMG